MPSVQRAADAVLERITRAPFLGAWRAVAVVSVVVTVVGGVVIRLTDPDSFPSVWSGLWWSAQTVTTVGYGDVVPESAVGRVVAVVVMLGGIAFITVTTAAIASAFVEAARRRTEAPEDDAQAAELRRLRGEIEGLRADVRALREAGPAAGPTGAGP